MHQHPLARFQLCIVEQHVFDGGVANGDAGGIAPIDAGRDGCRKTCGMVGELLRKAIDVESAYTGDILAEVVASTQAGATGTTDQRGVRHDAITCPEVGNALTDRDHLAGRLRADGQWKQALGECHAPKAPEIDVVQTHATDTKLYLAMAGRWRWIPLDQ